MDNRAALRVFLRFSFVSSFSYCYFLIFLSQASYLSHNRLFPDLTFCFYFFSFMCWIKLAVFYRITKNDERISMKFMAGVGRGPRRNKLDIFLWRRS